jgi:phosphoribosylaminoimidazole-succinocarboxamide synthase
MEKRQQLYRGKAKTVYATDDPALVIMHFRDDTSAFDGTKVAQLPQKGETNNKINAFIMGKLAEAGVATHFVRVLNERDTLVRALKMIPVECVVRNVCAGSMAKRYGIAEGTRLAEPIFEFFYKSDALHDPLVNDDHIRVLGWASTDEIKQMKALTHKSTRCCNHYFRAPGSISSITSSSSDTRWTTRRVRCCSATSSRPTAAGSGTTRPRKNWTRTASGAILAR